MIRVGLAGYGLAGATFHAPLVRACERMELAGVLTSREAPSAVRTLDELIEVSDLVIVATPNRTHFPIAKAALEAGRHVVIDKPFTVTVEEADQLIALAAEKRRKLSVFQNRRWDGDYLTVRSVLPELGDVRLFEAHWDRFRLHIRDSWKEEPEDGNGLLADLGPHLIDQALQLFGIPDSLQADITTQRTEAKVDDYFEITLHYGAMRAVLCASTLVAEPRPRFAIHGSGGSFVKHGLDPQEEQLKGGANPLGADYGVDPVFGTLTGADGSRRAITTKRGCYMSFYEGVADAILNDTGMPVDAADAREIMRFIALAKDSARDGLRIPISSR